MTILTSRSQRRELERENARRPVHLELVPSDDWPKWSGSRQASPTKVWRSRDFLVQFYPETQAPAVGRLSVLRTSISADRWSDGITWDDLQRLKGEAGFALCWAVEVFPSALEVVNVANIRHLWLMSEAPAFAWKR